MTGQQPEVKDRTTFLEKLPEELGIHFTDVDVKIVRETKQRSVQEISLIYLPHLNQLTYTIFLRL